MELKLFLFAAMGVLGISIWESLGVDVMSMGISILFAVIGQWIHILLKMRKRAEEDTAGGGLFSYGAYLRDQYGHILANIVLVILLVVVGYVAGFIEYDNMKGLCVTSTLAGYSLDSFVKNLDIKLKV